MLYQLETYRSDLDAAARGCGDLGSLAGCRVLITGASGLIGSFIADMLVHIREEMGIPVAVTVMGRNLEVLRKRFYSHEGKQYIRLVEQDVMQPVTMAERCDYVIHAASNAHPAAFAADPAGTLLGNILGTRNLLEYARKRGSRRLLFVSSGEVYGQSSEGIESFDESYSGYVDPVNPRSCYPAGKRAAETLCVAYHVQYNVDTIIARPCHVYGPTATCLDNRASAQFIGDALTGREIVLKSPGAQLRSYCYVADCAGALLTILLRGQKAEAYNIADASSELTILELARKIAALSDSRVVFKNPSDAELAGYSVVTRSVLSTKKLEGLGWRPVFGIDVGLCNTLSILRTCRKDHHP